MSAERLPVAVGPERIDLRHLATKAIEFYAAFCYAAAEGADGYFTIDLASEWRETERIARGLLEGGVPALEIESALQVAIETLTEPNEEEAANAAISRFVGACVAGAGARRGEFLGITVADDELGQRSQKRSWRRFASTVAFGLRSFATPVALVGRVVVEFSPGPADRVELWPPAADQAMEESLADAFAAARDHALHQGSAQSLSQGVLRVYFGGYPWPFVPPAAIFDELAIYGLAGRSLALPVALAAVRALEGDRSGVGDHQFIATGDVSAEGRVRRVAKTRLKQGVAERIDLPLLYPAGGVRSARLPEHSRAVSTLDSALGALAWDQEPESAPSLAPPRPRRARRTALDFGIDAVFIDERLRTPEVGVRHDERVRTVLRSLQLWAEAQDVLGLMNQWDDVKHRLALSGYQFREQSDDGICLRRDAGLDDSYLDRFAALSNASDPWDFRRGIFERFAAGASLPSSVADEAFVAATRLGMRQTVQPAYPHYEYAVVLGGARLAPLYRVHWIAQNLTEGRISVDAIVLLGSERKIDPKYERSIVSSYAPTEARTEFDLLHHALLATPSLAGNGLSWEPEESGHAELDAAGASGRYSWKIRRYRTRPGSPRIYGVVAPLVPTPEPRTTQSLRFLHEQFVDELPATSRVLLATSMIYVPYQQVEGMRALALPHDLIVDTTGHPNTWTADVPNFRGPGQYLQEIRSTLQACARLAADYPAEASELVDVDQ